MTGHVIIKVAIAYRGIEYLLYSLLIMGIKHCNPHNSSAKQVCLLHLLSSQMTHPTLTCGFTRNLKLPPKNYSQKRCLPSTRLCGPSCISRDSFCLGFFFLIRQPFPGAASGPESSCPSLDRVEHPHPPNPCSSSQISSPFPLNGVNR